MSLGRNRPVVPVVRCNFERCLSTRAQPVNLDGQHERTLCDKHEQQLREALSQPLLRVTWGWTRQDREKKSQPLEAQVERLVAIYGEPDYEVLRRWELAADAEREPELYGSYGEDTEYPDVSRDRIEGWYSILELGRDIERIWNGRDDPVVRVKLRDR